MGVLLQPSSPIQKLVFEVIATERSQLGATPWVFIGGIVRSEALQFWALIRVETLVNRGVLLDNHPPSVDR